MLNKTMDHTRVEIFVFGSNLSGIHGKGAALWAKRVHGAVGGQGEGLQGTSYAIPTKGLRQLDGKLPTLPLGVIQYHVNIFCAFAQDHPEYHFILTPIGCGLAGYKHSQIAPMFNSIWHKRLPNVQFPPEFISTLELLS